MPTREILTLISRYNGITDALGRAETLVEEGRALLACLPEVPAKEALRTISDYVLKRDL